MAGSAQQERLAGAGKLGGGKGAHPAQRIRYTAGIVHSTFPTYAQSQLCGLGAHQESWRGESQRRKRPYDRIPGYYSVHLDQKIKELAGIL